MALALQQLFYEGVYILDKMITYSYVFDFKIVHMSCYETYKDFIMTS